MYLFDEYCCLCVMMVCCFFFFKQKTAYEMRISDWSSDVCSSDLISGLVPPGCHAKIGADSLSGFKSRWIVDRVAVKIGRASCRKECVSTCRSRWSPYH